MVDKNISVEKVVSAFTQEEKSYHESMLDAGYTPEMVGESLIYTRPAMVVGKDLLRKTGQSFVKI